MRRVLLALVTVAALAATAAGCGGGGNPLGGGGGGGGSQGGPITVGSANFPENSLLAEIYAQALEAKGVKVKRHFNIGSRETYLPALQDGSIDMIPEYTGSLATYLNHNKPPGKGLSPQQVYTHLEKLVPKKLTVLRKAGAEDKDAVVVTQKTAKKYDLKSIGDLKPYAPKMVLGGPPEWAKRYNGVPGLKKVYGLKFKRFRKLDTAGPITVKALKDGTIDAGNLFTTDGAIKQNNFVVLSDPKHLFLPENVVPIVRAKKVNDKVKSALNAVSAKLTTEKLKSMVKKISVDKEDPAVLAKKFLEDNGITQ